MFTSLPSSRQAKLISEAERQIIYVAPGIRCEVADAIITRFYQTELDRVFISIDFNETTLRMGYGELAAVENLIQSGIDPTLTRGIRNAFLIVDDQGWVFTPTALYLESEPAPNQPNAMQMTREQVTAVLRNLLLPDAEEPWLSEDEISDVPLSSAEFDRVAAEIQQAPPVKFDAARQVRIFQPYLQYVEMELLGARIQTRRVEIPPQIMKLGSGTNLEGRLRTTFQMINQESEVSSASLEDELRKVRDAFTPSLGNKQRVILKAARKVFDERIAALRKKLEEHQKTLETKLQAELDKSKADVVKYYLPMVTKNPPDSLIGGLFTQELTEVDCRAWLEDELSRSFPKAEEVVKKMTLEVRFKDVTFETLNDQNFLEALKKAYPRVNWDKPYNEFQALAGKTTPENKQ